MGRGESDGAAICGAACLSCCVIIFVLGLIALGIAEIVIDNNMEPDDNGLIYNTCYEHIKSSDSVGTRFIKLRTTNVVVHGSHLWRIFTGDVACPRDERGSYFLDRDGQMFRHILNYLRSDRLTVPRGFREFDLLKVEADYFGLESLVQEVDAIIQSRKRSRRRPPRKKTSQSVQELHRVHERNGHLYISDEESDWFYD